MPHSRFTGWNNSPSAHGGRASTSGRTGSLRSQGLSSLKGEDRAPSRRGPAAGFAYSLDVMIAVTLVIGSMFLFVGLEQSNSLGETHTTIVEDTLFNLENTGYIIQTLDTNAPSQSAALLRAQLLNYLPTGFDANVTVTTYFIDTEACALNQDFASCFPDANKIVGSAGGTTNSEVVAGKKYFLRKQPPGDCNISFIQFGGAKEAIDWISSNTGSAGEGALLTDAFFAPGDLNVVFDVNVTPGDAVVCDQNITISLGITVPEDLRKPVDLVLVLDRSGSMSWGGRASTTDARNVWVDGNYAYAYLDDGSAGIRSINVSNPLLPTLVDREDPGTTTDLYGDGNYIYTVDTSGTDQLFIINKTNPANLTQSSSMNFQTVTAVFALNSMVYVIGDNTAGNQGLYIVDATNKSAPVARGNLNLTNASEIFVRDTVAYVVRQASGLTAVNVSNPLAPAAYSTISPGATYQGVFVYGNYAFVAAGSTGLVAIDVTNPSAMVVRGTYNTPGTAMRVYVDNNIAYVADNTSLQAINVATPSSMTLMDSFATPYSYSDVFVKNQIAYLTTGSTGLMTIDTTVGPRLDNAQLAATTFADFNGWTLPPDQLGVVQFNTSSTVVQQLTSTLSSIHTAINSITSTGGTNIQSGIDTGRTELTSVRANPNAIKFQVVLSDGQSTTGNSAQAALDAAAQGIIIFTIAFGADADQNELATIAANTGGESYVAADQNALIDVFKLIALKVGELANDSNVSVPVATGSMVVNDGNGTLVGGNLVFNAGSISVDAPWTAQYVLNFPCNNPSVCSFDAFTFPGPGTVFNYIDTNGNFQSIDFNASVTLNFRGRDLNVDIIAGEVVGPNDISLDLRVSNVGELDANGTTLNIYWNDTLGELLASLPVPPLCSLETLGCTQTEQDFTSVNLDREGVLYATINDDNALSECPIGNIAAVNCFGGPQSQVTVVDYAVWRN